MKKMIQRFRAHEDGFTLVELLVVIAILGVLAGIAVFTLSGSTTKAKSAACKTDVATVESAAAAYNAENGAFPTAAQIVSGGYMKAVPADVTYTQATGTAVSAP